MRTIPPSDGTMEKSPFQWSAVAMAIVAMVYFAALYEPIRLIVLESQSGMNVGGVGGVGGLANLVGPVDAETGACDLSKSGQNNFKGEFCYERGWKGTPLTSFAWITLAFWVGPLLLACCWQVIVDSRSTNEEGIRLRHPVPLQVSSVESGPRESNPAEEPLLDNSIPPSRPARSIPAWLLAVWIGLNSLWFIVPLTRFGFGLHEISDPFERQILTVGLAAAHPLSWNAAFVVIPAGGMITRLILPDAAQETANMKHHWFGWHRLLGYSTIGWAVLHGGCELVYLTSKRERFRDTFDVFHNGESLLYLSGLLALSLLITHAFLSFFRKRFVRSSSSRQRITFRGVHTALAALFLTIAACHWWPFALFFVPATAIQGAAWGASAFARTRLGKAMHPQGVPGALSRRQTAGLLGASLWASLLLGFMVAWAWRQSYMLSSAANLYIAFVFPILSVVLSLLASTSVTVFYLAILHSLASGIVNDPYQAMVEPGTSSKNDHHEATYLLNEREI